MIGHLLTGGDEAQLLADLPDHIDQHTEADGLVQFGQDDLVDADAAEGLRLDEPVLAGIRPGEQRVYVEGMSSGTRDQLYLALRLASLEKYMESSEPMPFIVDDILVDFDDARSQAALQVLAELAERMQIILFTHHLRLVEQAQQLRGAVTLQEL